MALKIELIYCFSVIAESDSFHQAAERLFISQQALSKILSQLEQDVGQLLIYRNQRGRQRLTRAGEHLYTQGIRLLSGVHALEALFSEPCSALTPPHPVRIGAHLVLENEIARLLLDRAAQHRLIAPSFFLTQSMTQLEHGLVTGNLDFALLSRPPLEPGLAAIPIGASPYVIVGASQVQGAWDELNYLSFINGPDQEGGLNVWPEQRWPRQLRGEAELMTALRLCAQGLVCLHLPHSFCSLLQPLFSSLHIVTAAPFEAFYQRYFVWRTTRPLAPAVAALKGDMLTLLEAV